jgi:large subunit ribosomal protein L6
MSRLAKKPIIVPENVSIAIEGSTVTVKGPLGELTRAFPSFVVIARGEAENEYMVTLKSSNKETKAMAGTAVAHLRNMVKGVQEAYTKKLILEGVGFKSDVKGEKLVLALGFSHPVEVEIPKTLKVTAEKNVITVSGINKDEVGQFAAEVRSLKKPEPYKGKGFRYFDEVIRRKQGKKSA